MDSNTASKRTIILVEMENCLCDLIGGVENAYQERYGTKLDLSDLNKPIILSGVRRDIRPKIKEILKSPGFYRRLEPVKGSLKAIQKMVEFGLEVWIVISTIPTDLGDIDPSVIIADKIGWILDNIGFRWNQYIVCSDKSLLKGNFLIDPFPSTLEGTSWEHIVFDQPFNRHLTKKRLSSWSVWKEVLNFEIKSDLVYFVHGSEDSLDMDTMYQFPSMPEHKDCLKFCSGCKDDRNIIVVNEEGVLTQCFRGPPDELNNELLETYSLHKQEFPLSIKKKVHRIVPTKVISIVGYVLFRITHPLPNGSLKTRIKDVLRKGNIKDQLEILSEINFSDDWGQLLSKDELKLICFRIGQSLALIEGKELYTKRTISSSYPELKPFIYRETASLEQFVNITKYKNAMVAELCKINFQIKDNFHLLYCEESSSQLLNQCKGMLIDFQNHSTELLTYPWDKDPDLPADWPTDASHKVYKNFVSVFKYKEKIMFVGCSDINSSESVQAEKLSVKYQLEKLNFGIYFHMFVVEDDQLRLVGLRHKHTLMILPEEAVQEEANICGCKGPLQ